jgi:hypothetical protein
MWPSPLARPDLGELDHSLFKHDFREATYGLNLETAHGLQGLFHGVGDDRTFVQGELIAVLNGHGQDDPDLTLVEIGFVQDQPLGNGNGKVVVVGGRRVHA